jgi:hypothetical protein
MGLNIQLGISSAPKPLLTNETRALMSLSNGYFVLSKPLIDILELDLSKKAEVMFVITYDKAFLINCTDSDVIKSRRINVNRNGTFRYAALYESLLTEFSIRNVAYELGAKKEKRFIARFIL